MKTQKIQNLLVVTLFCAAALAGLTACDADPVEREGGKLPDKDGLENTYGMLRSTRSVRDEVRVFLTEGNGFVTDNFYYQLTRPLGSALSLEAAVKAGEGETERTLLPEANYDFPDGKKLDIAGDAQHSALKRIRFFAENLAPGEYYLPLTVAADAADAADAERQTVNYLLTVRGLQMGEYKLNQEQVFTVFYLNTALYQPLLVDEYLMSKLDENWENAWPERPDGTRTIGDIVNLRTVVLDYDAATSRALLNLGADMRYVLGHATKYIRPLQDKGRKVCISIEGGGKGLGFCNLTDAQIADFTAQVKAVVTEYGLDGVNFWDRNSGYGKEGMPAMNTTSYPKLIKAVREALGDGLLVTLTDHMEPTEYFWDTAAMGGIEVGQYLDYAWSGYLDNSKDMQIVDPWHQGAAFVSAEWPRKPIAGLAPAKYGCVNIPWYTGEAETTPTERIAPVFLWRDAGYKQSNILVFEDMRTLLQDKYESTWGSSIQDGYKFFADDGVYLISESPWGTSYLSENEYTFDSSKLGELPDGRRGYNKWTKDW